jgi:hypothetical protein
MLDSVTPPCSSYSLLNFFARRSKNPTLDSKTRASSHPPASQAATWALVDDIPAFHAAIQALFPFPHALPFMFSDEYLNS